MYFGAILFFFCLVASLIQSDLINVLCAFFYLYKLICNNLHRHRLRLFIVIGYGPRHDSLCLICELVDWLRFLFNIVRFFVLAIF